MISSGNKMYKMSLPLADDVYFRSCMSSRVDVDMNKLEVKRKSNVTVRKTSSWSDQQCFSAADGAALSNLACTPVVLLCLALRHQPCGAAP